LLKNALQFSVLRIFTVENSSSGPSFKTAIFLESQILGFQSTKTVFKNKICMLKQGLTPSWKSVHRISGYRGYHPDIRGIIHKDI